MSDLVKKFPRHEAGLYLIHNAHKDVYEKIEQYYGDDHDNWVSENQRLKALSENSVWDLQWYPDTPIGSYRLLACDLDVLLEEALRMEARP